MDPMVSARVPAELRDQVNEMLRERGSTPTALINGAYRQFRETGVMPGATKGVEAGRRVLSDEQRAYLVASIAATTRHVPEEYFAGKDYEDILEEKLRSEYAALA